MEEFGTGLKLGGELNSNPELSQAWRRDKLAKFLLTGTAQAIEWMETHDLPDDVRITISIQGVVPLVFR